MKQSENEFKQKINKVQDFNKQNSFNAMVHLQDHFKK